MPTWYGLTVAERFWSKVLRAPGCWPWLASTSADGYGQFYLKLDGRRRVVAAPRVAFWLTHGHRPENALHTCDNPLCCNPDHIYDGTLRQNAADRDARRRHASVRTTTLPTGPLVRRARRGSTERSPLVPQVLG